MSDTANIKTSREAIINWKAICGDTFTPLPVTFTVNSVAESFVGATLRGQVKKWGETIATLDIDITGNSVQYSLTAEVTVDILPGVYEYDVEKTVGDLVQTIQKGTIIFNKDITQ